MRLSFHALLATSDMPSLEQWQNACRELGLSVELAADNPMLLPKGVNLNYTWRGQAGSVLCYVSPPGDVADICDEWHAEIRSYRLSANFDYNGSDAEMPGAIVAAAALVQIGRGAMFIEDDGVFLDQAQTLELARQWESSGLNTSFDSEVHAAPPVEPDANTLFQDQVAPALGKLLLQFCDTPWLWDLDAAREQLAEFGYHQLSEDEEALISASGSLCRIHDENQTAGWIEFILCAYPDPHLLDEVAFSAKQDEYETLYRHAVRYTSAMLGQPEFDGASGQEGFPVEQWADWAAVWRVAGQRLMVQQKHNDPELPLELCLVFAPDNG